MKLGVFLPNGQNGYIVSNSSPQYVPTYQHMLDITRECERIGLDFILSMINTAASAGQRDIGSPVSTRSRWLAALPPR
jgi:pyrimidine oxygenase